VYGSAHLLVVSSFVLQWVLQLQIQLRQYNQLPLNVLPATLPARLAIHLVYVQHATLVMLFKTAPALPTVDQELISTPNSLSHHAVSVQ
jgi:hypothetical protein